MKPGSRRKFAFGALWAGWGVGIGMVLAGLIGEAASDVTAVLLLGGVAAFAACSGALLTLRLLRAPLAGGRDAPRG